MKKVSKKDKRNYPFDTNQNKLLLTLIFNFTTTKISKVNFINNVSKITDLEKIVIKDLTQIMPMYPKEKDTLEKELIQSFTVNWETNTFDEKEIYPYMTEGIGEDIIPKNVDFNLIDLFEKVSDKDAALMTRELAKEEGNYTP